METVELRRRGHCPARRPGGRETDPSIAGRRVLVAEDDASARGAVAITLRALGLDVIEADDGGRTLVALAAHYKSGHSPDDLGLLITDVRMPVIDGIALLRSLRAAHWTGPVIITTGLDSIEVRLAAAQLGAVLLFKPIDLDVLERRVRELLSNDGDAVPTRELC